MSTRLGRFAPNASYAAAGVDIDAGEPWSSSPRTPKRAARPRSSAVSAASPDYSRSRATTASRCWPRPATASAPSWPSRKRWAATTPSVATSSPWSSTTSWSAVPNRFSCGTIAIPQGRAGDRRRDRQGIADGCVDAGCALLGGETAEHPDSWPTATTTSPRPGWALWRPDEVLSADRVRAGDVVIAMALSGLHSNGYSLARKVLLEWGPWTNGHVEGLTAPSARNS